MPTTTAIVLARDHVDLTLRAIHSVVPQLQAAGGSVLLVDQASSDDTAELVALAVAERVPLTVVRNSENQTFSAAANQAAAHAPGDYLLFLHNDAALLPGALQTLVAVIESDERIGAAGPKLLYPNGQIQEAGLALPLWLTPLPVGLGARAEDHRFSFPRSAFALGSACLLVRRPAFEQAQGFDLGYRWGSESVDLCLALRQRRYRSIYEPRAKAVHVEGATLKRFSHLTDADGNRKRFLERWGTEVIERVIAYLDRLAEDGDRRFFIYGDGDSGRHLASTLEIGGYDVMGFLTPEPVGAVGCYPAWSLAERPRDVPARVLIGSRDVRAAEDALAGAGLLAGAALPILAE